MPRSQKKIFCASNTHSVKKIQLIEVDKNVKEKSYFDIYQKLSQIEVCTSKLMYFSTKLMKNYLRVIKITYVR